MDDEEIIRDLVPKMLEHLNYDVELTRDGAEAIESYRKAMDSGEPFDAVILDLTVPDGMGGKEAIKKLLEIDPGVKGIVTSGDSEDPIIIDFKEYGFSGAIAKPFGIERLGKNLCGITNGEG